MPSTPLPAVLASASRGAGGEGSWAGWFEAHEGLLAWMFVASIGSLVLVAALLPVVVVRLPADYFATTRVVVRGPRGIGGWLVLLAKNLLGVVFLLVGFAMLFLPGQGVLTMLIGLLLVDAPGKRAIERRIVRRPAIRGFLDRLRARRGKAPFVLE